MRRAGTKYARLVAKKWPLARKKGDALVRCRYIEFTVQEIAGGQYVVVTYEEELDCLLYEVDPKSVDLEKYHEADKIICFPWCDISRDPIINAAIIEIESGRRWTITGILSDDPIKALTQCSCTRWNNSSPVAKMATGEIAVRILIQGRGYAEEMFWTKAPTGTTEQVLTDSYAEVQSSIFGPDQDAIDLHAGQRVRLVYSASISMLATGASGAQVTFQAQKSAEPEGQPPVWADMEGAVADYSMPAGHKGRPTWSVHDQIPLGLAAGTALLYRLVAKRSDSAHGATLHVGDTNPTISIDAEYMYQQGAEEQASGAVLSGMTVSGTAEIAKEADGAVSSGMTVICSGETAEEASGAAVSGMAVSGTAEKAADASGAVVSGMTAAGAAEIAKEVLGAAASGMAVACAGEIAEDAAGATLSGMTVAGTAELAKDAAGAVSSGMTVAASGLIAEEAAGAVASGMLISGTAYLVEETIWTAPPSDPPADELGMIYEVIQGVTVTIPGYAAGLPSVRMTYNGSISLLAVGVNGGICTLRLQTKLGAGSWEDEVGQTATKEFAFIDQEARFTFALNADFPDGIAPDTEVQLRVVGKTDAVDREVNVHDSLIDPDNTAPSAFVQAEYFF